MTTKTKQSQTKSEKLENALIELIRKGQIKKNQLIRFKELMKDPEVCARVLPRINEVLKKKAPWVLIRVLLIVG